MRAIRFIINSNFLIALAAFSLALATEVELGISPHFQAYLVLIFLATLSDYNLHRIIAVYKNPDVINVEKFRWAAEHLILLKILMLFSLAGQAISMFFVKSVILYILAPLALLSLLYSIPFQGKQKKQSSLLRIPGIKTFLIATVWTTATVILPVLQSGISINNTSVFLIFAERFAFIFAIAIPFDIRDMKADALAGIRTIPVTFGEKRALLVSNSMMGISLAIALFHYLAQNMIFIFIAYSVSIALTLIFINSRKIKDYPIYYHGILDGSIMLHGLLISLSIFLSFLTA